MACPILVYAQCHIIGGIAGSAAENAAGGIFEEMTTWVSKGAANAAQLVITGWVNVPTVKVSESEGAVPLIRDHTATIVAFIAVGSLLVTAIRLALDRDGRTVTSLGKSLVILVLATAAGVPAVRLLVAAGDEYSMWIVDQAADGNFGRRLLLLFAVGSVSGIAGAVMFILALLAMLSSVVQAILMFARGAALVVLAGLLPVAAAAGLTETGTQIRNRYFTWLFAFILYKPAAATIYASAFWMVGESPDANTTIAGICLLAVAIVALPALIRLIAPAVTAVSYGGRGNFAGAMDPRQSMNVAVGATLLGETAGRHLSKGKGSNPSGAAAAAARGSGAGATGGGKAAATAATAGKGAATAAGAAATGPAAPIVAAGIQAASAATGAVKGAAEGAAKGADPGGTGGGNA